MNHRETFSYQKKERKSFVLLPNCTLDVIQPDVTLQSPSRQWLKRFPNQISCVQINMSSPEISNE